MTDLTGAIRLFGVVDADETHAHAYAHAHGHTGVPTPGTELVTFRDLGAVVEPATFTAKELDDEALGAYIRVVDAAAERGPIVPAPPGTVFRNVATLRHWLELHYATLHETLGVIERRQSPNPPYEFVRMQFGN